MTPNDKAYYLARAKQEREAATNTENHNAALIHRTLAREYSALAQIAVRRPISKLEG